MMKTNHINIASKLTNEISQKLSLSPGQIIRAQVIKAEGNHILLQYGSYLFKAETDLALKTGTRLKLVVESANDKLINLKIIDKNEMKSQENTTLLTPGQKSDQNLESIAQQLMKFNLPVSPEFIAELNIFLKKNTLSSDIGQLVVWLRSVGIKVNSEQDIQALQTLQKFFLGLLSSNQESRFFDLLNQAENQYMSGLNIYGWPMGRHHIYLIKQGAKSEPLLPEICKLAIKLDSVVLQELWFVVEISNNNITANIVCKKEKYKNILEREVANLKTALEGAGYLIRDLTIKVDQSKTTIFDLLPEPELRNINLHV